MALTMNALPNTISANRNPGAPSLAGTYMLWVVFGLVGVHRCYLGRLWSGLALFAPTAGSFVAPAKVGAAGHVLALAWWAADAFFIPGMMRTATNPTAARPGGA